MSEIAPLVPPSSLQQLSLPEWRQLLHLLACFEALPQGAQRCVWMTHLMQERPADAALLAQFCAAHRRATAVAFLCQPAASARCISDWRDRLDPVS